MVFVIVAACVAAFVAVLASTAVNLLKGRILSGRAESSDVSLSAFPTAKDCEEKDVDDVLNEA